MMMKTISVNLRERPCRYRLTVGSGLVGNAGIWARKILRQNSAKLVIVSNEKVYGLYGKPVQNSLEEQGFEVFVWLMEDGEEFKNLKSLESALRFFSEVGLTRTDSVAALGGGVVGDLAGLAAALYLRGVSFLQIPTTLLSMIDSSVGGKTAVNTEFGKNLIGVFSQPSGVLVDVATLRTLDRRELTAGFCEAVKQGAVGSRKLFDQTARFLSEFAPDNFRKYFSDETFLSKLEKLVAAQIAFKASVVEQDEREEAGRIDAKSRKILNFGHTLGHALERVTEYKRFKHGEAVGHGILFAGELSKKLELLDKNRLKLLNDVVAATGTLPDTDGISVEEIIESFSFDKKLIDESLHWVLLKDIGEAIIRPNSKIPGSVVEAALKEKLQK